MEIHSLIAQHSNTPSTFRLTWMFSGSGTTNPYNINIQTTQESTCRYRTAEAQICGTNLNCWYTTSNNNAQTTNGRTHTITYNDGHTTDHIGTGKLYITCKTATALQTDTANQYYTQATTTQNTYYKTETFYINHTGNIAYITDI